MVDKYEIYPELQVVIKCKPRDHFTVMLCLFAWPLNESEAGVELVLIETSSLSLCKFLLIRMRTVSLTKEVQGGFYQNNANTSLTFIQWPGNYKALF